MSSSNSVCQICNTSPFRYCCPKCNILYCSIVCYKSKSHLQCSEQFYKKCVEDELLASASASASTTSGQGGGSCSSNNYYYYNYLDADVRKMHEILQRVNNENLFNEVDVTGDDFEDYPMYDEGDDEDDNGDDGIGGSNIDKEIAIDSDDENDNDLAKRLEGVNINDPDAIWNRLTNNEKYEFEKLVETGEITKLLPQCQIWWEIQKETKLIEDLISNDDCDNKNNDIKTVVFSYPEILGDIQPLNTLIQRQPSSCLIHNITNVLASYAYMVRSFNNEHRQTPQESVNFLVALSATLKSNANYDSNEQAIKSVIYEGQIEGLNLTDDEYEIIREDVRKMFEGRYKNKNENLYILSALSDIHRLLTVAKLTKSLNQQQQKQQPFVFNKNNKDHNNDYQQSTEQLEQQQQNSKNNFSQKFFNSANYNNSKGITLSRLDRRKLNQLIKKVEYYLAYINSSSMK